MNEIPNVAPIGLEMFERVLPAMKPTDERLLISIAQMIALEAYRNGAAAVLDVVRSAEEEA